MQIDRQGDPAPPASATPPRPMPPRSVLARTATGMGWIVGWRMATRVLGLLNTLILVRLLAPSDFGLVALGTGFLLAVDTLSVLGVEDALVRHPAPTPAMYDTAFTMAVVRGLVTAALIAAVAVPVGHFFAEPRLATVLMTLAVGSIVYGLGNIGVIDFRRDMAFHREFVLLVVPRLVSIVVTIAWALIWRDYWALVAGILTMRVGRSLMTYTMHPLRPRLSLRAWRDLIGFSVWSWAVAMGGLVRERIDQFVIGRVLSATEVGIYAIGEEVAALPTTELVAPLCRACFSGFTVARQGGGGLAQTYMRAVSTTFLVTLPIGLGVSLLADPLVRLAVGTTWLRAVPVIEVLGVMGSLTVFGYVAAVLLSVHAALRLQFWVGLASLLLRLALLIPLVARYGIVGAAIGSLIGVAAEQAAMVAVAFRRYRLSYRDLWRRNWRVLLAAAAMAAVLVGSGLGWSAAPFGTLGLLRRLALAGGLGALSYAMALLLLWRLCGRPEGAESDLLAALRALARTVAARLRAAMAHAGAPLAGAGPDRLR